MNNQKPITSPLLDIEEIEGLQLDEEESGEDAKSNQMAVIESVSERQMSSSRLRDSEMERWGFPEELGERDGVHMPLISQLKSNFQILTGMDYETPSIV
jgi:hypothetical protein